jgi:hypothetical protein
MPWGVLALALWPLWVALGVTLGGMLGLWLAERRADRIADQAVRRARALDAIQSLDPAQVERLAAEWRRVRGDS